MDKADWIELTKEPIPVTEVIAWIVQPGCGAIDLFCGTVRDHSEDRQGVEMLEYEAYEPFVAPKLEEIAREARVQWPEIGRLAFLHRIGALTVGEISVLVAVSTPHRAEAFESVRWSIDALKTTVPIWKREIWKDGAGWGLGATELPELARRGIECNVTTIASVPVSLGPSRSNPEVESTPNSGALVDRYGRVHRDLRISITDRCNLRCVYCMPEEGVAFGPRSQILSYEELARVARIAHGLGVTRIRITGGEPLVRRGLESFVARLAEIGFNDLSMTTNGIGLARRALGLAGAGLHRVNISCDSLRPDRFPQIRRSGALSPVLAAMDAAERAGLSPIKVNVVVLSGINDEEIVDFAAFARDTGRIVRFIEYMPLDGAGHWDRSSVVPAAQILETIGERWELEPVVPADTDPSAPATRYRFTDGTGEIGVIPTITQPFCGTCDRLRITADGAIRNCLFASQETPLRHLMRNGGSDDDIARSLRGAVYAKLPGHGINDPGFLRPARSMSMIGG